jgi:hypothetical protein
VSYRKALPGTRWGARLVGAAAAASMCVAMTPSLASAELGYWKSGALGAQATDAGPTRTSLTSSAATADISSHLIDAGAHYPGSWTLFANYAEGWGIACHNYGGESLGALVYNPHSVTQNPVDAIDGYVANGSGSYC